MAVLLGMEMQSWGEEGRVVGKEEGDGTKGLGLCVNVQIPSPGVCC